MMSIGIVLTFAGYTVGSYGYVLIRGWDITFRQWVSPFNPWQWQGEPQTVPQGQIMPGGSPSAASGSGGNTGGPVAAPSNPDLQGIPQPGVQGTVAGSHGR